VNFHFPADQSLCEVCGMHTSRHTEWKDSRERHLCCECYVREGNPPADWHVDCMKAKR
jgi:hypothetical protein